MRELSVYRMRQFFADELKRLDLFEDLAAGINLEAALLMRRIPTNAGRLILSTRYPEELEAAVAAGRQARKEEDKLLREKMRPVHCLDIHQSITTWGQVWSQDQCQSEKPH